MSYILDALAHAHDARAQRGLRTLSRRSLWQTVVIGLLLATLVALGVAYLGTPRKSLLQAADAPAARTAQAASAGLGEVPSMAPRPPRRASAPAATVPDTTAPARPAARVIRPEPRFNPPTVLSQPLPNPSPNGPGGSYAAVRTPPTANAVTAAIAIAAAAPPARVVSVSDLKPMSVLPVDTRQAISQMKLRVLFYTPQRRSRFIVIDGRELREGGELFEGVRLEEITDTGLVLRHNNTLVLSPASPAP